MESSRLDAGALYRAHAPFVAGFLMRLGVERMSVEDLVHEVFVVAHQQGGYSPGPARPTTWLAAIAARIAANHRRARSVRQSVLREGNDDVESLTPNDPETSASQREQLARVQRCLDALPDDQRAVFVLFEVEGEDCASIAHAFNIPVGTVYSRLHTARKAFLQAFQQDPAASDTPRGDTENRP